MSDASKAQKLASARKKFKELKKEKQQKQNNVRDNLLIIKPEGETSRNTTPEPEKLPQNNVLPPETIFQSTATLIEDQSQVFPVSVVETIQQPATFFDNKENSADFIQNEQKYVPSFNYNSESNEDFLRSHQNIIDSFNVSNEHVLNPLESSVQFSTSYFDQNEQPKTYFEGNPGRRVSFFDNFVINPENSYTEEEKQKRDEEEKQKSHEEERKKNDDTVALENDYVREMFDDRDKEPQKTMQNLHEISNNIQKLIDPLVDSNLTLSTTAIKNQELLQQLEEQKRRNEEILKNTETQPKEKDEYEKVKELLDEERRKNEELQIKINKANTEKEEKQVLLEENQKLLKLFEEERQKPQHASKNDEGNIKLFEENQKLLQLLEEQQRKNDELYLTIQKQDKLIAHLQNNEEIIRLQNELQTHIQTIQILITDKNELAQNLTQIQNGIKQKQTESDELQGRLKTSRSRVADLERETNLLKQELQQYRQNNELFNNLKMNYDKILDERNELQQDSLEIKEKLKTFNELNDNLKVEVEELKKQLSLAQIKIQQLSGDLGNSGGDSDPIIKQKQQLEQQITSLNEQLQMSAREKEESALQYQQYAQQLNNQITNLTKRIEELQVENNLLKNQEQDRIKHIGQLEKILQDVQEKPQQQHQLQQQQDYKRELEKTLEDLNNLSAEKLELKENYTTLTTERDLLLKELNDKKLQIEKMENIIDQLKSGQTDNVKLLATMESDKVAASRAMQQNAELKKQLEGMQEVFIKINEDKVQLTEYLEIEKRNNKELFEKLQKTELHLQTLAEAIEIKDKELSHLRESSDELEKQMLQAEQLNDRLRHYEAQDNSSNALQLELQEAQQIILQLNNELKQLKSENVKIKGEVEKTKEEIIIKPENDEEAQQIINKLQKEIRQLKMNKEEKLETNKENEQKYLDKEAAMKRLEEKFLRTMKDVADLTEEKQRLEHLVLQLQGETETIGEYVALYQHQRSVLKQRAIEKDQQVKQLEQDRELIKNKLDKLKYLVERLVTNGELKNELLNNHNDEEDNKLLTENGVKKDVEIAEIIDLLSEIKTSNLVQPTSDFHHCPCCHGQLITV